MGLFSLCFKITCKQSQKITQKDHPDFMAAQIRLFSFREFEKPFIYLLSTSRKCILGLVWIPCSRKWTRSVRMGGKDVSARVEITVGPSWTSPARDLRTAARRTLWPEQLVTIVLEQDVLSLHLFPFWEINYIFELKGNDWHWQISNSELLHLQILLTCSSW